MSSIVNRGSNFLAMFNIQELANNAIDFAQNPHIKSNATISFATSSGIVTGFDLVGNPVFDQPSTTILECYLWQTRSDRFINNQKNLVGTDQLSNYYIGRLVTPKTYNFPIRANGEIKVTLNNRQGRLIELMQLETASSIQYNLPDNLGQKIACYIEFFEGN